MLALIWLWGPPTLVYAVHALGTNKYSVPPVTSDLPLSPGVSAHFLNWIKGSQHHIFLLHWGCLYLRAPQHILLLRAQLLPQRQQYIQACPSVLSAAGRTVQIWHQLTFSGPNIYPWEVGPSQSGATYFFSLSSWVFTGLALLWHFSSMLPHRTKASTTSWIG